MVMDQAGLNKLLLSLATDNPDAAEQSAGVTTPSPSCLPLSRVRAAVLRESWSDQETRHLSSCPFCRKNEQQARSVVWHPSLLQLFSHVRQLQTDPDTDVSHHLQRDTCRRCLRLSALLGMD